MSEGLNDNVTVSVMRRLASHLATFWAEYIRPMPFSGIFHVGHVRVKVEIDEYKTDQDTKPLKPSEPPRVHD